MPKITDEDLVERNALFPPTAGEKLAIDEFLAHLERAGQQTLARYQALPPGLRSKAITGMIEYWKRAVSVLSWGRSINDRRKVRSDGT